MNPIPRPAKLCRPRLHGAFSLVMIGLLACIGLGSRLHAAPDSVGRFLLVASEGLYVVEPDGRASWSYNPPRYEGQGWVKYDHLIYDGCRLPNGHFLYAAHRYAREIDADKKTVWEYKVEGTTEVKTCVPVNGGRVAVLNSREQAVLELESGTGKVLHRIAVPAKGSDHTRYNLLRPTPKETYLVTLRDEKRFVEVTRAGEVLKSFDVPGLPVVAERLADGSTLCSGMFGLRKFDVAGKETWSLSPADVASEFPLLITAGFVPLPGGRILAVNSDWHYKKPGENRVQAFVVDQNRKVRWTLDAASFHGWKRSETEPATGMVEHRGMMIQLLH